MLAKMTPHSLQDREGPGRLRNQAQTVQCCIPAQGWALTNDRFLRAVMQYRNTLDQDTGLQPTHIIFHIWKTGRRRLGNDRGNEHNNRGPRNIYSM